jgi:hypothetical protein
VRPHESVRVGHDRRDGRDATTTATAVVHLMTRSAALIGHQRQVRTPWSGCMGFLVQSVRAAKPPGRSPAPHERKLSTQHTWATWCTPPWRKTPGGPDDRLSLPRGQGAPAESGSRRHVVARREVGVQISCWRACIAAATTRSVGRHSDIPELP